VLKQDEGSSHQSRNRVEKYDSPYPLAWNESSLEQFRAQVKLMSRSMHTLHKKLHSTLGGVGLALGGMDVLPRTEADRAISIHMLRNPLFPEESLPLHFLYFT